MTGLRQTTLVLIVVLAAACETSVPAPQPSDVVEITDHSEPSPDLPPACSDPGECPDPLPCRTVSCTAQGQCRYHPVADDTPCDDHNLCTSDDRCLDGQCTAGPPASCDDGNPCTVDSCNPAEGCAHAGFAGGCDDGNACTTEDGCVDGVCVGIPLDCNDGDPCTSDSCDIDAGCLHGFVNGLPCNDGDACTEPDSCQQGTCTGPQKSCDDGNPCTADSCNPAAGCVHGNSNDECDDGNACTTGESCFDGLCAGGSPVDCDDGNACTVDSCNPAAGCAHGNSTAECDDGNPCTVGDSCALGQCVPGKALSCQDGNPCTLDTCDIETGTCHHLLVDWACDDGDPCTVGDSCIQGTCAGSPASCDDGNPCTNDLCLPGEGCTHLPNSNPCDDGNLCTLGDTCAGSLCKAGPSVPLCDDGNTCTDDHCDPLTGECLFAPNNAPCDDSNACTLGDQCADGACQSGDAGLCQCESDADCLPFDDDNLCNGTLYCNQQTFPPKCALHPASVVTCSTVFDSVCRKSVCQPATGLCLLTDMPPGTLCSDGNPCTAGDHCSAGLCAPGTEVSCDDDNPCTEDLCDPEDGCLYSAKNLPCDDGNFCTIGDHCVGGNCIGVPTVCEDGNPCTKGLCDPASGKCSFPITEGSCNDGNPCTVNDTCDAGLCVGSPKSCDDNNPCTADACEGPNGCVHMALGGACDDGNACTATDECIGGKCKGSPISCNDANPCTDDLCDMTAGCKHPPNVAPCNDADACTYGDHCTDGECSGLPVSCNDGNPCTSNYCHSVAGCIIIPLDVPCTDGSECTVGDWCVNGTCIPGQPQVCDDGNYCTLDLCNPLTGLCEYKPTGWPCDDDNACTTLDLCSQGACAGFPVNCADGTVCTSDSCDPEVGCLHTNVDGVLCDDSNHCTADDICQGGECVGQTSVTCSDNNICTGDVCVPVLGCLFPPVDGGPCDDGEGATLHDTCLGGTCQGQPDDDLDGVADSGFDGACAGGAVAQCNDNCPDLPNPDQEDGDGDGIGDACEQCGPVQAIDGQTAPDPGLWLAEFKTPCPAQNKGLEAQSSADGPSIVAWAERNPACDGGTVRTTLTALGDLSGEVTAIEVDLALEAAVYPAQFLGTWIATIAVAGPAGAVTLVAVDADQESLGCGLTAVVPTPMRRAVWRFEVDGIAGLATVLRDGVEVEGSPFDLTDLGGPWHLRFQTLSGDLATGCGAAAAVRIFGYERGCGE
jgi:hypothetical protein